MRGCAAKAPPAARPAPVQHGLAPGGATPPRRPDPARRARRAARRGWLAGPPRRASSPGGAAALGVDLAWARGAHRRAGAADRCERGDGRGCLRQSVAGLPTAPGPAQTGRRDTRGGAASGAARRRPPDRRRAGAREHRRASPSAVGAPVGAAMFGEAQMARGVKSPYPEKVVPITHATGLLDPATVIFTGFSCGIISGISRRSLRLPRGEYNAGEVVAGR